MRAFIARFWSKIDIVKWGAWVFGKLKRIGPFTLPWSINKLIKRNSDFVESSRFIEVWVLFNLLFSLVLLLICSAPGLRWWEFVFIVYGGLRVLEVIIYQINVLLFDEYRAKKEEHRLRKLGETYVPYAIRGFRRIVILLLHNYVEIIFWFALFYRNLDWAFETGRTCLNSFFTALNFSFAKMTTFGYTTIYPKEHLGDVLVFIQSTIGLFMVLLILARFISLLPKPKTLDEFEK